MAYIGSGVFFAVRKAAYKDIREKEKVESLQVEDADGEALDDDRLAALFGLYKVYLPYDEEPEDKIHPHRRNRSSSNRT
jgi:hypothetical protein